MPDFSLTETGSPPIDSVAFDLGAPDAPTSFSATVVDATTADLAWTNQEVGHDGVKVYRDDGSGATEIADLAPSTIGHTDSAAPNGTQLDYHVEAYYDHTGQATASNTDTVTTPLPDVQSFVLDASTVNELLVMQIEPVLNAGRYRIQWKEADVSSYPSGNDATLVHDASPLTYDITGVLAGEKYDIRLRSETDDITGAWLTASKVTKLVPADGLQATNVTETGIDLSWADNSSPFDGSYQIYRDREDYDFADPDGELIGTVGDTATSFTDTTASPNTAYEYTVRAVTQWVQSSSDPLATTTAGPDVPKTRTRRAEWTVEIRLSDRTLRPPIVDEPSLQPRTNDLPKIRMPTTEGPWSRLDLEDGPEELVVWFDGIRQPIESLERVEDADSSVVLVARGGTELLDRVQTEVDQQTAHGFAENVIQDNTDYVADVDAPPEALSEETIFDTVSASAWANLFSTTDLSRLPVEILDSGGIETIQSNWVWEAEDADRSDSVGIFTNADFSGDNPAGDPGVGAGQALDSAGGPDTNPSALEYDFTTDYTIPEQQLELATRWRNGDGVGLEVSIDGQLYATVVEGYSAGGITWTQAREYEESFGEDAIDVVWTGDLEPGTHTLRYEVASTAGTVEPFDIDVVSIGDRRYDYNYDDDPTAISNGNYLDGPQTHPEIEISTDAEALVLSVVGAELTTDWDNTEGSQSIQVSNDGGDNWYPQDGTEQNIESVTHDWASPGATLQARLSFGRHGSRESTPATGFEGQRVSSLELVATLDDTPLVVNQSWDTSARGILRDVAEQAGGLWDVEYDPEEGMVVNWTYPGVREATVDDPITTYDVATDVRERAARVVVLGANSPQVGDRITADHGTAVSLQRSDLVSATEAVYDPDSGASYQRDDDYGIDYGDGTITTLGDGDIGDGQDLAVDYEYETRGSFESEEANTDIAITRNINTLTSPRQCAIAARRISLALREPLIEAEVGYATGPTSWSVIEQLTDDDLPVAGPYEVRDTETRDGQVHARLGSRQSVEEIVADIRANVQRNSRRT